LKQFQEAFGVFSLICLLASLLDMLVSHTDNWQASPVKNYH
jgi:hypothetical protein